MKKTKTPRTDRRKFLQSAVALGSTLGGASLLATRSGALAAPLTAEPPAHPTPADLARAGSYEIAQADVAARAPAADPDASPLMINDPGSDFMVDCIKSLDVDYIAVNPGGNIRGLHESIIHYGGNKSPELISVTHEETGVALCHGYYKFAGKPMAALIYGDIGLQHAAMAVYNAYADRVPIILIAGNRIDADKRAGAADWYHAGVDLANVLQGGLKWANQPTSLQSFGEDLARGYKLAMTEPMGPVLITADAELSENPMRTPRDQLMIPKRDLPRQAVGDPEALAEAAKLLANAEYPVIVISRAADNQAHVDNIVKLAETLGAAVITQRDRMVMPNYHPLNLTGRDRATTSKADVLLFLGCDEIWPTIYNISPMTREVTRSAKPDAKVITIGLEDYSNQANLQDQQRFFAADLPIYGSPAATIPYLTAAIQQAMPAGAQGKMAARVAAIHKDHADLEARDREAAAVGWDASPITTARMCAELGDVLKTEDWSLVSPMHFLMNWPQRLWKMDKWYHFRGTSGAGGEGYIAPAAIGAALANQKAGRLSVSLQTDGDLLYLPGTMWTAAHHKVPVLSVMHNNRAYHAEYMNIQQMSNRRNRGVTNAGIGTLINNPNVDFAGLVKSLGVWGAGPITDPKDLRPALVKALEVVKAGEPALVDVYTQPR